MTRFGYTLMTEQSGPRELVRYSSAAEAAGFDFEVMSDHYSPWLTEQGHSPYAWSVLGAVAQVTSRVELMTYITCPTMRYHPAVVAQKAATVALLSEGRFTLGLGSGENLNEHTIGRGWPGLDTRHDMLAEAIDIIRELHAGDLVTYRGTHFAVDSARVWDLPRAPVRLAVAVAGPRAVERFAPLADDLIAVEPDADLVIRWNAVEGARRVPDDARAIGQIPICWDPDEETARKRAHEQFRWFGGGWSVNADLPTTAGFAGASKFVSPDDVADSIPCGPTWTRSWTRCGPSGTPASPTWRWCRSATRVRTVSSTRPRGRSWASCGPRHRAEAALVSSPPHLFPILPRVVRTASSIGTARRLSSVGRAIHS